MGWREREGAASAWKAGGSLATGPAEGRPATAGSGHRRGGSARARALRRYCPGTQRRPLRWAGPPSPEPGCSPAGAGAGG
jgi:hypothetical protein